MQFRFPFERAVKGLVINDLTNLRSPNLCAELRAGVRIRTLCQPNHANEEACIARRVCLFGLSNSGARWSRALLDRGSRLWILNAPVGRPPFRIPPIFGLRKDAEPRFGVTSEWLSLARIPSGPYVMGQFHRTARSNCGFGISLGVGPHTTSTAFSEY